MRLVAAITIALFAHAARAQPFEGPLSPVHTAAGWTELSGPDVRQHWQLLGDSGFPTVVWSAENGEIRCTPNPRAGSGWDLVTTREFGDFELIFQFKLSPSANSGVKYLVDNTPGATQAFGPEYQVLDDAGTNTPSEGKHASGSLYDILPAGTAKKLLPPGEWNTARIRVRHGVTQHWLNGTKTIETRLSGPEWDALVADSKFKDSKSFARSPKGHIALQDHGGEVAYRNIRVRELDAALPGEVALFNATSLDGWTPILNDGGRAEDVWSVRDGLLICTGKPAGYIRTRPDFTNYVLRVVWRFDPVTKAAGNSGVLLRVIGEDKVWPRSVEAQLQSGAAGDFWNIGEFPMKTDDARRNGRNTRRTHTAERAIGEWNEYEIVVDHDRVTIFVNGEQLNAATAVLETAGAIALQSEGTEIHFKTVRLAPIP